jgi:hypothetical protein
MVNVIAPLFSLSASGLIGKTIFYYDTKYGARVRKVKGSFTPPGSVWEVNKEWFKLASDRFKHDLTAENKWAWKLFSSSLCDTYRDVFMGVQIEYWNLSPLNDITWPLSGHPDVGEITFWNIIYESSVACGFDEFNKSLIQTYCPCTLWAVKLDDASAPGEDDIVKRVQKFSASVDLTAGHINYVWGGVRYTNGDKKMLLVCTVDRT